MIELNPAAQNRNQIKGFLSMKNLSSKYVKGANFIVFFEVVCSLAVCTGLRNPVITDITRIKKPVKA